MGMDINKAGGHYLAGHVQHAAAFSLEVGQDSGNFPILDTHIPLKAGLSGAIGYQPALEHIVKHTWTSLSP